MSEMINLFLFLMQKEKTTCKEISDKLNCSIRTAQRKVDKLSLTVPIIMLRGRQGGVLIDSQYKKDFIKELSRL